MEVLISEFCQAEKIKIISEGTQRALKPSVAFCFTFCHHAGALVTKSRRVKSEEARHSKDAQERLRKLKLSCLELPNNSTELNTKDNFYVTLV